MEFSKTFKKLVREMRHTRSSVRESITRAFSNPYEGHSSRMDMFREMSREIIRSREAMTTELSNTWLPLHLADIEAPPTNGGVFDAYTVPDRSPIQYEREYAAEFTTPSEEDDARRIRTLRSEHGVTRFTVSRSLQPGDIITAEDVVRSTDTASIWEIVESVDMKHSMDDSDDILMTIKFHNGTFEETRIPRKEYDKFEVNGRVRNVTSIVRKFSKKYYEIFWRSDQERITTTEPFFWNTPPRFRHPPSINPSRGSLPISYDDYVKAYREPKKKCRKYYSAKTGLKKRDVLFIKGCNKIHPKSEECNREEFMKLGSNIIPAEKYHSCKECFWYSLVFHQKEDVLGNKIIESDEDFEKVKVHFTKHFNKKHKKIVAQKMMLKEAQKYT